jgi:hypothetical protein
MKRVKQEEGQNEQCAGFKHRMVTESSVFYYLTPFSPLSLKLRFVGFQA